MYIVSKLTSYDHEDELYYTKIGLNDDEMSLYCIVAGKSAETSKGKAENLVELLNSLEKSLIGNVKEQG